MAQPRATWKGYLRLSLVTIEVALFSAVERSGGAPALRQLHAPSGKRVRYQKIAPGIGPVDDDDIVKGYEIGGYVVLEADEIDEIKLETKRAIRLAQFVDAAEVDPRYFERPYYLTPEGEASAEGFVVIREALRRAGKMGLGQMTMRGREHLVAIRPCGPGPMLETLRYADEVRESDRVFEDIPDIEPEPDMLDLAGELIERKSAAFDPAAWSDSYATALRELIERKREGEAVVGVSEEDRRGGAEVVDLMAALKNSLSEEGGSASKRGGSKGGHHRRPQQQGVVRRQQAVILSEQSLFFGQWPQAQGELRWCRTASPATATAATSTARPSRRAARPRGRSCAMPCRSTTRGACITTCGWSMTARCCNGPSRKDRASSPARAASLFAPRITRWIMPPSRGSFPRATARAPSCSGTVASGTISTTPKRALRRAVCALRSKASG
jgi:DNA end-binding protein Ku